jgi:hypothetical protein
MSQSIDRIRLTERGWRLLAGVMVTAFVAVFFADVFIGVLSLGLGGLLVYSWLGMRRSVEGLSSLVVQSSKGVEGTLTAGQVNEIEYTIDSTYSGVIRLGSPIAGVSFEPSEIQPGGNKVSCVFKPRISGEYSSGRVEASLVDGWKLFEDGCSLPFVQSYRVYPRVLEAVVEATEYLMQTDVFGSGAQLTRLRGGGSEYADTRPYVVGDSVRQFDWKASARLDRLMVKEFYLEGGVRACVLFEAEAGDAESRDEVSAAFLRVVTMYARMDAPLDLVIYDKSGVLLDVEQIQPSVAVGQAMKYALDVAEVEPEVLYELLDPRSTSFLRGFLGGLSGSGVVPVSAFAHPIVNIFTGKDVEHLRITAVSSILDPVPLIELARLGGARGWTVEILQPTRPWISAGLLEGAVERWRHYEKMYRVLERGGVYVSSSLEELREREGEGFQVSI